MKKDKKTILKVLVGSRAHGLATVESDFDFKAIYVLPTSKILSLNYKYKGNDWIEGNTDNVSYEIGHFLQLATQCNPTILEVFKAPIIETTDDGNRLRTLFDYVWNPKRAFDAFVGYGLNQRKKFLDKKDNRQNKYATAYTRTLIALNQLIMTGDFTIKVPDQWKNILLEYKCGSYSMGDVIDCAEELINKAKDNLKKCKHEQNIDKINEFLLDIRKRYWE